MRGVAIGIDLGTSDIRAALVYARRDVVAMPPRPLLIFRAITRDNGLSRVLFRMEVGSSVRCFGVHPVLFIGRPAPKKNSDRHFSTAASC
jgi:hypothetical protein